MDNNQRLTFVIAKNTIEEYKKRGLAAPEAVQKTYNRLAPKFKGTLCPPLPKRKGRFK